MSDIRAVIQELKPWPSRRDPRRYYVNDWMERIGEQLLQYAMKHPKCPDFDLLRRVGKVWYDTSGFVHVDGIYNRDLTEFIARTMSETQFTEYVYIPSPFDEVLEWSTATDDLPHDLKDETYFFRYKGEVYPVNVTVYCWERENNKAYRQPDGSIQFESKSSALWELVLMLIADGVVKRAHYDNLFGPNAGGSLASLFDGSAIPEPQKVKSEYARDLSPDDPERVKILDEVLKPKPESRKDAVPDSHMILRRVTDEELEQWSREAATETTHPKTGWTKAEVMDVARRAGVPERQLSVLSKMRLDEIRSTCLIYDGTDITGNEYNSMQQRHTKFYRLDIEYIKSFGDGD